ncbi:transferase [Salipaludibacillus keqinensis]|uniref:Transferase n=1 Tax=Salipaludibacillus keqinensis TaxID=2045207 RepID=A0A323TJW9_9BACI|nr:polysaccharide pyruvyl transferase family protein [Salipaludibacillus keqinensis]PYZ95079.1 transferase [Salipaludibacillus keqinensis]
MRKLFVDIYLQFNLGDDLFLDILARRYPKTTLTLNYLGREYQDFLSQYENVQTRDYSIINKVFQRLKLKDTITNYEKIAQEQDGLLFIGGSIFREESYHGSLYMDRLKMIEEFTKRKKPVYIIGANFGPYNSFKFFKDYEYLFKLCEDVCFRDYYSFELFKHLPQVRYAPDIVFSMDVEKYREVHPKKVVGYSIIDVNHKLGLSQYYEEYILSTTKSIEMLVSKGYMCCLMSFCKKEGDLKVIEKVKRNLSAQTRKYVTTYVYKGDINETLTTIASFSLFIAARFHANIVALLFGIGLMPVIYSQKTMNILEDLSIDKVKVPMNELNLQHEEKMINEAFKNTINTQDMTAVSIKHFDKLTNFLKPLIEKKGAI